MFYLCTGFHRSGTSLLAQTLRANNVDMGADLMGATFSNPLGHVEDMPVVRLHDKVYKLNGSDWRYHDSSALLKPVWLSKYLKRYLLNREATHPNEVMGVKDPRAVHFLKEWQVAHTEQIKYIFIYRHWREACFSLLNRHSRHFLNTTTPISNAALNLSFWQQPSLAFDMWLSANKRMLKFYEAHSQHAVLISQEAFVANSASNELNSFSALASKIGLEASHFDAKTLKPNLLTKALPFYASNGISSELINELDEVYAAINRIADMPNHAPLPQPTQAPSNTKTALSAYLAPHSQAASQSVENIFKDAQFDFSELTWVEFTGALVRLPIARVAPEPFYEALIYDVDFTRSGDSLSAISDQVAEGYYSLAKVAHYKEVWLITYLFQMRSMLCNAFVANNYDFTTLWDMQTWVKFCTHQEQWLHSHDAKLQADHPFKLHQASRLPTYLKEQVPDYERVAGLSYEQVLTTNTEAPLSPLELHVWLICNTPQAMQMQSTEAKQVDDCIEAYLHISQQYPEHIEITEFCLIKALRSAHIHPSSDERDTHVEYCLSMLFEFYTKQAIFGFAEAIAKRFNAKATQICSKAAPVFVNTLRAAIKEHHFQWAQTCMELLKPYIAVQDIEQLTQTLKTERESLRPAAGLKHRFALLPNSLSYEAIQIAGTESPMRGKQLDLLNQRLNFLAKDNIQWLSDGASTLHRDSATCMVKLIDSHWQKLWPKAVYQYLFNNAVSEPRDALNKPLSTKSAAKSANRHKHIIVNISCFDSFSAFLALFNEAMYRQCDTQNIKLVFILGPNSPFKAKIEPMLSQFHFKQAEVYESVTSHEINNLKSAVTHIRQSQPEYLGIVHCHSANTHLDKLKQLCAWYAMLGYEFGIDEMLRRDKAQLIVPDYHPSVLAQIQNKALFFPISHMAWIHEHSLDLIQSVDAPGNEIFWNKLLMANKKAGNEIKMTQQACSGLFV